jgi:hypothetical protein
MHKLGILDKFLKRPHQEARELGMQIGEEKVIVADFTHLPHAMQIYRVHAAVGFFELHRGAS